jgi:serine/threonine-protein kinase
VAVSDTKDLAATTVVQRANAEAPKKAAAAPLKTLRLLDEIGRGGMGVVYRAEQGDLERTIAFKELIATSDAVLRERFVREARITAQLDHPNVVPVHSIEIGQDGTFGIAMKLVDGKTLKTLQNETIAAYEKGERIDTAHSLEVRLEIFLKICDALAFAHAKGILHRDLKPANVMIGRFGEVYVMDWGIARAAGAHAPAPASTTPDEASPELTRDGDIIGSPMYMSPEQAAGRHDKLDERSDEYALGLILFEIVCLQRAIRPKNLIEAMRTAMSGEKEDLVHVAGKRIPRELRAIVEKATAFAPDDRYPTVTALADDVRRYLRGQAVIAEPDPPLQAILRAMSRYRRTTLAATVALVALSAAAIAFTQARKSAAELALRERADRQTAFSFEVAEQGHQIDAQLERMQMALEGLRTAAEWALAAPEPRDAPPIFLDTDFADPKRRPADFTTDTTYRWPVSVDAPVVGIAPSVDRSALLPKIYKLAPLASHMRAMFLEAGAHRPAPADERDWLLHRRGPIDYAYVDLAEGVHFVYPGMASLPAGYDVRTSSFYKNSDHGHGKKWGRPYIDATTDVRGDDLVLPCTQGLWSSSGEFLGIAGVEITVTKLVGDGLALPHRPTLRASLVDRDGKKIIDSTEADKRFRSPSGQDEELALTDFDMPDIARAIRAGEEGARDAMRDGRRELVAFVRLGPIEWFYVVEVDRESLGIRKSK